MAVRQDFDSQELVGEEEESDEAEETRPAPTQSQRRTSPRKKPSRPRYHVEHDSQDLMEGEEELGSDGEASQAALRAKVKDIQRIQEKILLSDATKKSPRLVPVLRDLTQSPGSKVIYTA